MTQGIVLIAYGHQNYIRMALNLAVSIKSVEDFPITLITDKESANRLEENEYRFFDTIVYYKTDNFIKVKTKLYQLSPYDETLYLDVDMLWLPRKKPSAFLYELSKSDMAMISEGFADISSGASLISKYYTSWFDIEDAKRYYKKTDGRIHQLRSEIIYFKKSPENKKLFKLIEKIFKYPKIAVKSFAGTLPDEFAFNLAFWLSEREPFTDFQPAYWEYMHGSKLQGIIYDNHFLLSLGGMKVWPISKRIYNDVVKNYSNKNGIIHPIYALSKNFFLTERELL